MLQEVKTTRFCRQSAQEGANVISPTHRPSLPLNKLGNNFCYRLSRTQGHSAAGRIMSMKKSQCPHQESTPPHCLNQIHHRVSQMLYRSISIYHNLNVVSVTQMIMTSNTYAVVSRRYGTFVGLNRHQIQLTLWRPNFL